MRINLLMTGHLYHAAESLPDHVELTAEATLDDALQWLAEQVGDLPPSCLVAVNGRHLGTLDKHRESPLNEGDELALIAPVAGG